MHKKESQHKKLPGRERVLAAMFWSFIVLTFQMMLKMI